VHFVALKGTKYRTEEDNLYLSRVHSSLARTGSEVLTTEAGEGGAMQPASVVGMLQPFMARARARARPISSPRHCLTFWLSRDGLSLRAASDFWKSDFEAVLTAVKHNGNALEYASENLRGVLFCFWSLLTVLGETERVHDGRTEQHQVRKEFQAQ